MPRTPRCAAVVLALVAGSTTAAQSWTAATPGDWLNPGNWTGGSVPNAIGASATILGVPEGGPVASPGTFTAASPITLGSLTVGMGFAGPSVFFNMPQLIFDNGGGADVFVSTNATLACEISSDVVLMGDLISNWRAGNGRISGTISGDFGITHDPDFESIFELAGVNTYTGETRILNGRLRIKQPEALGSPAAGTFVTGPTSSLIADFTGTNALEPVTLENGGRLWLRNLDITSDITIVGSGGITPWFDNTTAIVSGTISGGQFIKTSAQSSIGGVPAPESILYLSNPANTFTGGTIIRSGVLAIESDGSLGTAGTGITFDTVGFSDGPPALATRSDTTIDRPITMLDNAGLRADENTTAVFPQTITGIGRSLTINAPAIGNAITDGFNDWTGTVVLQADNTYNGGTLVQLGTLVADNILGSATGSGPVVLEETATLAGGGIIFGAVNMTAGGALQPGAPVGSIITGPITMGPLSVTHIEIESPTPGQFDRVFTSGPTTLDGELVVAVAPLVPLSPGDMFEIVTAGSISGTFATVTGAEDFDVIYDANSVTLVFTGGAACPADLDADSAVGSSDLAILLAAWGLAGVDADFDGGTVGASDLAILLAAWGPCP